MGECEKEPLRPKEFYREKIISMINKINRTDILNYIYVIVSDIMKERAASNNELYREWKK